MASKKKHLDTKVFVKELKENTLLTKQESEQAVALIFNKLISVLLDEKKIKISGFGEFYMYTHKPRPVCDLNTNTHMMLEPFKSLKFKPTEAFRKELKKRSMQRMAQQKESNNNS